MELTQEDAIKIGFLYQCAEEGLSIEETHQRVKVAIAQLKQKKNIAGLEKQAVLGGALSALGSIIGGGLSFAGRTLQAIPTAAGPMLALGVGLPILGGFGSGLMAAKLTSSDRKDALEEAKQDEVIAEYERLADEAKRRALLKRIHNQTGKRVIPLTPSVGP